MIFKKGIELNEKYYFKIIKPLMSKYIPKLHYSAALIGYGSDVLGYDDETSMDHNWGPRLQIFIENNDISFSEDLKIFFKKNLPEEFLGFPTNFTEKRSDGTQTMEQGKSGRINHLIEIYDIDSYFIDIFSKIDNKKSNFGWLLIPEQRLLELTSGKVYYDGLKRLTKIRNQLKYYPRDIKLLKIAAYWNCIYNEEAFIGRCRGINDHLGVKLISGRIINYILKICFVLKEEYIPYSKWFIRKFNSLNLTQIKHIAESVVTTNDLNKIENLLADLYMETIEFQNSFFDMPIIEKKIRYFYSRPFKVIMADEIVAKFIESIEEKEIKEIDLTLVGMDNKIDSEDFTDKNYLERILKRI